MYGRWGVYGRGGSIPAFCYIVVILRISFESDFAPTVDAFEVESEADCIVSRWAKSAKAEVKSRGAARTCE